MSVLNAIGVTAVVLVAIEGAAWAIAFVSDHLLDRPIPRRRKFLAEQTRMVDLLAHQPDRRDEIHPVLGWWLRPGYATEVDHISAQGLRSKREYTKDPVPGILRISAFGDSHVYCNEVPDDDAWPAIIEAGWKAEVLNYGVGGYGADQVYLRFRDEGLQFHPQTVIIGFTSVQVPRMVSRYRRFQNHRDGTWFKPRFVVESNGSLRLIPPPVASREDAERLIANPISIAEVGKDDAWYIPPLFESRLYEWSATYRLISYNYHRWRRRYLDRGGIFQGKVLNLESPAFQILEKLFLEFVDQVRATGAKPIVLMLPGRGDLEMYRDEKRTSYETAQARFEALGIDVLDAAPAMASTDMSRLFRPAGHYTREGNDLVANYLAKSLNLTPRS